NRRDDDNGDDGDDDDYDSGHHALQRGRLYGSHPLRQRAFPFARIWLAREDLSLDDGVDLLLAKCSLFYANGPRLYLIRPGAQSGAAHVTGRRLGGGVEGSPLPPRPRHEAVDERAPPRDERDLERARRRQGALEEAMFFGFERDARRGSRGGGD